jgi:HSP20 family protein
MKLARINNGNGNSDTLMDLPFTVPSVFDTFYKDWDVQTSWLPAVNITERREDYKIDLAVPGMNKNDFRIEADNGILKVSGERKDEVKEENENVSRREFHYGSFSRSFTLPEGAEGENTRASYKDGILTLLVPKKEEAKQKPARQITVS